MFRVFCWSHDFRLRNGDPMHAPIWVSRPHLPIVFFFEFRLFSIVSTFGIGLTLDGPTKLVSRPNVARCRSRSSQGKPPKSSLDWIYCVWITSKKSFLFEYLSSAGSLLSLSKPGRKNETLTYQGRTPGTRRFGVQFRRLQKEYIPLP